MKIGLVIYGGLASNSGGYLYDRMMIDHLRRRGEEFEIISLPGSCHGGWLANNINPQLLRILRDLDVDVLVEDELCFHSLCLLNCRIKKSAKYPVVGLFHFLASRAEPDRARAHRLEVMERRFVSTLDGCIFNSAATAEAVRCLVPNCPGIIARPGRDHVRQTEVTRERSGPFTVLYIGSIAPEKGLDVLVKAIATLPRERFRLEVAGHIVDTNYMLRIWSFLEQHSMQRSVRFWGWVQAGERDRLMSRADVLAVPSYFEGYGLVFVEAMAYGLPVIAPACGGAKEIVRHGEEGFLVDPGDILSITAYLATLEKDLTLRRALSERAARRFDQLPTWGEEMEKVRSYLLSVANVE